jgi:hypothetical protein
MSDLDETEFLDTFDFLEADVASNPPHDPRDAYAQKQSGGDYDSSPMTSPMSSPSSRSPSQGATDIKFRDYQFCVSYSINLLRGVQPIANPLRQEELMTPDKSNKRFAVGKKQWKRFEIFPWILHYIALKDDGSIKETLNTHQVEKIVQVMNYFWSQRIGDPELLQLQSLFMDMKRDDSGKKLLSRIAEVAIALFGSPAAQSNLESVTEPNHEPDDFLFNYLVTEPSHSFLANETSSPQHPTPHIDPLASLNERVTNLENFVGINDQISPGSKRVRSGGDRASWYQIRDADYPSRKEWCTPGSVFGLYADGVGPLQPQQTYTKVMVYSTAPDTEEEHPNPKQPDRYVLIVMVGSRSPLPSPPLPLSHCLSDRRSSSSIETKSNREVEETALHLPPLREPGGRGQCPSD